MADRAQSQEETEKSRLTVPETAISMFQIRESAAQEIHRADNEAERRTRELGRALAVMSAILESTTDGIPSNRRKSQGNWIQPEVLRYVENYAGSP